MASPSRLTWPLSCPPFANLSPRLLIARLKVVGGPNARSDFHVNPTPELFYQYKGSMLLRTAQHTAGPDAPPRIHDVPIHEGSIYLHPPGVPHCPVRFADTVGIVVELPRPEGALDALRWYCPSCSHLVYEDAFPMRDLGTQVKAAVEAFAAKGEEGRRCEKCGTVCGLKAEGVVQP